MELYKQNADMQDLAHATAHLIHGSSEDRFRITYAPGQSPDDARKALEAMAAGVPVVAGERGAEERFDDRGRLVQGVLSGADRHHVGVVVLAGELGGLDVPGQRRPDAGDLVGGDLLAVAGAADHHPQAARVGQFRQDDGELVTAHACHGVAQLGLQRCVCARRCGAHAARNLFSSGQPLAAHVHDLVAHLHGHCTSSLRLHGGLFAR